MNKNVKMVNLVYFFLDILNVYIYVDFLKIWLQFNPKNMFAF